MGPCRSRGLPAAAVRGCSVISVIAQIFMMSETGSSSGLSLLLRAPNKSSLDRLLRVAFRHRLSPEAGPLDPIATEWNLSREEATEVRPFRG